MEEPPEDSGALTIYRLQKDGGGGLPAVPSDPRAGDAGMPRHGPLPAPAVNLREHDASPRVDNWKSGLETGEGHEGITLLDAMDRRDRFVTAASIHPSEDAGSYESRSDSSRAPEALESVSHLVQRDQGESNTRREAGRGTPSGDPYPARPGVLAQTVSDGLLSGIARPPGGPEALLAGTLGRHPAASESEVRQATAGPTAPPAGTGESEPQAIGQTLDTTSEASRVRFAAPVENTPRQDISKAASPHPPVPPSASPPRARPPQNPLEAAPRLHIGQIEVVVVAPTKPEEKSTGWTEDSFLSRHYLRRL